MSDRLVHGLAHPLPSTRMMAIIGLTGRADPATAIPLAPCAHAFPTDVVPGLEIVRAVAAMPDEPQRQEASQSLCGHNSRMVRDEANRLLRQ